MGFTGVRRTRPRASPLPFRDPPHPLCSVHPISAQRAAWRPCGVSRRIVEGADECRSGILPTMTCGTVRIQPNSNSCILILRCVGLQRLRPLPSKCLQWGGGSTESSAITTLHSTAGILAKPGRVLTACPLWKAAVGRNEIPGTVLEIVRTENDVPYFALQCGRVDLAAPLPQNPVPVLSICPARIHSLTVIVEEPYHGEELREAATGQQRIRPASRVAQNLAGAAVEQQPRMHPDADVERMDHQCRVC